MDPVTLASIAIGSSVAGGAVSGLGAIQGNQAQRAMYQYQAGIAQQNEIINKQNEAYSLMQGSQEEAQLGQRQAARQGQIRAAQGASGFNVNMGSQAQVQAGQEKISEQEQATLRSSVAKRAYDFDIGAFQSAEQASAYHAAAVNEQAALPVEVASSILGTASNVSSKWFQYKQASISPLGL